LTTARPSRLTRGQTPTWAAPRSRVARSCSAPCPVIARH
jgi:hypothetical protein